MLRKKSSTYVEIICKLLQADILRLSLPSSELGTLALNAFNRLVMKCFFVKVLRF